MRPYPPPAGLTGLPLVWEWGRAALLAVNLIVTTLSLGGYLPGTRAITVALTAALLAWHLLEPGRASYGHPGGWLLLPFLAYAAWNVVAVTPVRWLGWMDWTGWAQTVAVYWVVLNGVRSRGGREFLFATIAALGVTAAGLACYQHFVRPDWLALHRVQAAQFIGRSSGSFGIPNSLAAFMLLLLPPMGALVYSRGERGALRVLCGAAVAALALGFVLTLSRGAWIALVSAVAIRPLLDARRSLGRRIATAVVAFGGVLAVGLALYALLPALRERFDLLVAQTGEKTRPIMWRGAWQIFLAHPWFGGGGGSFNPLFEAYRPAAYQDEPMWAHNDYLNTLSDYGGIGFALLAGAVAVTAWRVRAVAGIAAAVGVGLLAFGLHLLVEFHFKIPALSLLFATLAAMVVREAWPWSEAEAAEGEGRARRTAARAVAVATAAAALGGTLAWAVPRFQAESLRRNAREKIDHLALTEASAAASRDLLDSVRFALDRAVRLDPANGQAWSDRAYADSLWSFVEPARMRELGEEAAADAARAIALSAVVAEFPVREGTGLDMQGRWPEGGRFFAQALKIAPARADLWYYEAYHLSLNPVERDSALSAADYCLRLDPGYRRAQALRRRLASPAQSGP